MSAEEVELLYRVALRFPQGPLTYRYALALGLNGDAQKASDTMKTILGMYGQRYYAVVSADMVQLSQTKFPQLKAVALP